MALKATTLSSWLLNCSGATLRAFYLHVSPYIVKTEYEGEEKGPFNGLQIEFCCIFPCFPFADFPFGQSETFRYI